MTEYLSPFPLLYGTFDCPRSKRCRKCKLTYHYCRACIGSMIKATSPNALPHKKFFRFRAVGSNVGFGLTTSPNASKGIRLNDEACGFLVPTKCFHFAVAGNAGENAAALHGFLLKTRYYCTDNTMGIAVDYEKQQILVNWLNRQETLQVDLPESFRNKVLYPIVQVWDGSEITVLCDKQTPKKGEEDFIPFPLSLFPLAPTRTIADKNTTENIIDEATISTARSHSLTNAARHVPPIHVIGKDSWCSGWIEMCTSRGLPRATCAQE